MPERITNIFKGNRDKVSKKAMPTKDTKKYKDTAFILKQSTRKTKMFANLGKITYGVCIEYKAFPTVHVRLRCLLILVR